jgi:hypothetical protein
VSLALSSASSMFTGGKRDGFIENEESKRKTGKFL